MHVKCNHSTWHIVKYSIIAIIITIITITIISLPGELLKIYFVQYKSIITTGKTTLNTFPTEDGSEMSSL